MQLDIAGGNRIPKLGDREAEAARVLAELRSSWRGVERLLLAYDGSPLGADFLDTVLSFLDPAIAVTLLDVAEEEGRGRRRPAGRGAAGRAAGRGAGPRAGPGRRMAPWRAAIRGARSSGRPSRGSSTRSS